jgi:hypothetical protein
MADPQQLSDVISRVGDFDSSVESANRETGRLSISYYSLIAWIALVTVALAAVAAAAFCRKLPGRLHSTIHSADVDLASAVTDSEIGEKSPPLDVTCHDADKVDQGIGTRNIVGVDRIDSDDDECETLDSRNLSVLQSIDETGDWKECVRL